jgi:hypothetical protein
MAVGALFLLATVAVGAADEAVAVEGLAVDTDGEVVEFTITSTEWVRYTYFELEGPRVVVDFHNAENRLGFWRRTIEEGLVEKVRAASFVDDSRDATRVVFHLTEATPYEVVDEGDGTVRVRFGIDPAAAEDGDQEVGNGGQEVDQRMDEADLAGIEEETIPVDASSEADWNVGIGDQEVGIVAPADGLFDDAIEEIDDAVEETARSESPKPLPYVENGSGFTPSAELVKEWVPDFDMVDSESAGVPDDAPATVEPPSAESLSYFRSLKKRLIRPPPPSFGTRTASLSAFPRCRSPQRYPRLLSQLRCWKRRPFSGR